MRLLAATVFGLSPTAAVLIAAALLLVVVLAIVAMTREVPEDLDDAFGPTHGRRRRR